MAESFVLPFLKKEQVAEDIVSFFFDRTQHAFNFLPGQYIRMILPHENPDERGTSRFFTIASSPLEKDIMITTKLIESSFKHRLVNLKPGDEVKFFGPLGSFLLDETETAPHVFLSGGMGITPFHSMMQYASARKSSVPLTLFASFSKVKDVIFYDELSNFERTNSNLKSIITVSEDNASEWKGEKGRITKELLMKHLSLEGQEIFYICGPTAMVDAMREIVTDMGVSEEQIRIENFSGY